MTVLRRWTSWLLPLAVVSLVVACAEKEEQSTQPDPETPQAGDEASGSFTTTTRGVIETSEGAKLYVPRYAVPVQEDGSDGTMVFSIEKDENLHSGAIQGKTLASDIYLFGPDGFTFGEMLTLTLPVTGDVTGKNVRVYRINQTTGESEPYSGQYSVDNGTITAQTYHLSPWYVAVDDPTNTAWGAFKVTNLSSTDWLHLCVDGYDLKYPTADVDFNGEDAQCAWAPAGDPAWNSSGLWYLPQGTYNLCVSMSEAGTVTRQPGEPVRWRINAISLDQPWTRANPQTTDITYGEPPPDAESGPCDCVPQSTTSVGTGDVQVTLTWHSEFPVDLDLYVTEPDGTVCFWMNPRTSTGGALDRDNTCGSYIDGRPENIFWRDAPTGTYKVQVNMYSTCGSNLTSMDFNVRVVTGTSVKTYSGSVSIGMPTVDVATFTISTPLTRASGGLDDDVSLVTDYSEYLGRPAPFKPLPSKD